VSQPPSSAVDAADGQSIRQIRAELGRLISMRYQGHLTAAEESRYDMLCSLEHRALSCRMPNPEMSSSAGHRPVRAR
jgi:hypothetical protein